MKEEWRACCGGYYEASSLGRVRRAKGWERPMPNGGVAKHGPDGDPLSPWCRERDGRYYVSVCINGKRKTRGVHQLVAEAFLGPRPDGLEVNHKNGDKTDNRASNLEYVTHAENCAHAGRLGLVRGPSLRGESNPRSSLTEEDVLEIRRRRGAGETVESIAEDFPVCGSTVDYAARGVNWSHVS